MRKPQPDDLMLRCPSCGHTKRYGRTIDVEVPKEVQTLVIICPKCDDGDFHEETWLDAQGNEVPQGFHTFHAFAATDEGTTCSVCGLGKTSVLHQEPQS